MTTPLKIGRATRPYLRQHVTCTAWTVLGAVVGFFGAQAIAQAAKWKRVGFEQ